MASERIEGSHLLVATGRPRQRRGARPRARRHRLRRSGIVVDKRLRTTNRRVYAIGDVAGRRRSSPTLANYHAGLVIRNALFRLPVKVDHDADPARDLHRPRARPCRPDRGRGARARSPIRVLRWPYHENDRAQAERDRGPYQGRDRRKAAILGRHHRGRRSRRADRAWTLAISQRLNIRAFAGIVVPYPTLAEIGKRAAITYFTPV